MHPNLLASDMRSVIFKTLILLVTAKGLLADPVMRSACGGTCSATSVASCCQQDSSDQSCCCGSKPTAPCCDAATSCCKSRSSGAAHSPCPDCQCLADPEKLPVLPTNSSNSSSDPSRFADIAPGWLALPCVIESSAELHSHHVASLAPRVPLRVVHCVWLI